MEGREQERSEAETESLLSGRAYESLAVDLARLLCKWK